MWGTGDNNTQKSYQELVGDYNKCINQINNSNQKLYSHETAYNNGDYSFAGGDKEMAKIVIAEDKVNLELLEKERTELEKKLAESEKK